MTSTETGSQLAQDLGAQDLGAQDLDAQDLGHTDVAIVGSGFSGLGMAIQLQEQGRRDFIVLEKADDVGGTWRDNTYPGAACDVPSHLYSFSFALNPQWTRSFSPQPEIWTYLQRCARDAGVMDRIRFGHEVLAARFDAAKRRWRIETSGGVLTARVLVAGTGPLSEPRIPDVPGADTFPGPVFHSARWDHSVDLSGKTVAVVGTGASAIQFVPEIQRIAKKVMVFQRTPPWVTPRSDRRLSAIEQSIFRKIPGAQKLPRAAIYFFRETYLLWFLNATRATRVSRLALKFLEEQVRDPELRAKLTPNYTIGCKRILISNDWYPTLLKSNVELLTGGLSEVKGDTVVSAEGDERQADVMIFGTGFHVTDMPFAERVFAADGTRLSDAWRATGMEAYLGTSIAGFPNLFLMIGPNTGLGHNSIVFMIESQIAYILDALRCMEENGDDVLSVREDVVSGFNEELQQRLVPTVWNAGGCRSWYMDSRGRNTTIWPGYTWDFRRRTRHFDRSNYERVASPATATASASASASASVSVSAASVSAASAASASAATAASASASS
jgi:cation diffusion facilitator CzcD-associated flavoprotein CzcO